MPTILFSETPLVAEVDIIFRCIKSFFKGNFCGMDGLRSQYLLDTLCGEGFVVSRNFLCAIPLVINLSLGERCPMNLTEFVVYAPLKSLLKSDGGI